MDEQKIKIRFYQVLVIFFAVLTVVIVYYVFWGPAKRFVDSLPSSRVFTVSGEGKVTAIPDIAKFSFSVVTQGPDPSAIADENNKKVNQAIAFIKGEGVEDKDIKTSQYQLSPRYSYDRQTGKSYIYGYELRQTVSVKIRDFKKIGTILGALPEHGSNDIGSISFDIDEPEKYLTEAMTEAFSKAKEKASRMAEEAGIKLGRVVSVSEYQRGAPIPYATLGRGGADMAKVAAPNIEPGSQEVTVNVSVTYEIR